MGLLENQDGIRQVRLRAHHRVGRAPTCDLRLAEPEVSGEHAVVRWTGVHWEVRDLGSRNGTWVDGRRLGAGEAAPLAEKSQIAFGGAAFRWRLVEAGAPSIQAAPLDGGEPVQQVGQIIALPDAEAPEVTVYRASNGPWVVDRDGRREVVEDGATITVAGRQFRLDLAGAVVGTLESLDVPPEIARLSMEFTVSQDEEHIEVVARAGTRRFDLGSRSHHFLLLTLARARLDDRADGSSATEEGWVYQDDLLKMLATSFNKLQVHVFRARRQLGEAGILNAADIVERRTDTGQIRIGVSDVSVNGGG
jgi:pSer/pThr/pTyr-binding forkhead associated (FHA) protein